MTHSCFTPRTTWSFWVTGTVFGMMLSGLLTKAKDTKRICTHCHTSEVIPCGRFRVGTMPTGQEGWVGAEALVDT